MLAKPATMMHMSSDRVAIATKGLTISGASVWPMNTFAATESVSAPLVPITNSITREKNFTSNCSTPK